MLHASPITGTLDFQWRVYEQPYKIHICACYGGKNTGLRDLIHFWRSGWDPHSQSKGPASTRMNSQLLLMLSYFRESYLTNT